ncbi:hypothetical protein DFH11DRAFT_1514880 [Phellopilus nigrolimitatus]|nr:hypothetical protein DFH11DRAFT_1514880 [Phellopilus nigrolimitatus]
MYTWTPSGYPNYVADDTYLRPVVPSPHPSPVPSPHGSPNRSPMYLDENYNYYQPGTGFVGVPMVPASFVPLPPSPSMLSATFVPLPPSPRVSPRYGPVPLPHSPHSPGGLGAQTPYYPQHNAYPFDPYYFPQAGPMYMNPAHAPQTKVHPLLKDAHYVHLDFASPKFAPLTPSGGIFGRTLVSVHSGYLTLPASYPVVAGLVLRCHEFGQFEGAWAVTVDPGRSVNVGDVLRAIHDTLQTRVTHAEWAKMSDHEVYEASRAYTRRCRTAEFEKMQGVRRVDLLGDKHWFNGMKRVKDDDPHNFRLLVRSK